MEGSSINTDAIVIGGGFYGAAIAVYLAKRRHLNVIVIERENALLTRASYNNQARVHNGYHYPRSFTTAYRSRLNLPNFVRDCPDAIKKDFTKIYAIARHNSKVTPKQFIRFCNEIGATLEPVDQEQKALFNWHWIEDAFIVEEYVFDAAQLAKWAESELEEQHVKVVLNTNALEIQKSGNESLYVVVENDAGIRETLTCRYVFNCTYSGLNQLRGDFPGVSTLLKHEVAELALLQVPTELGNLGITVMDGPFFSIMPFPARHLHTLTHVRYTPHLHWEDAKSINPYEKMDHYERETRVDRMIRDTARYMPAIQDAKYIDSLFEIKTVLVQNEGDDGRPILFEKYQELKGCYSVLGGKIDNIYDVFEKLEDEQF